MKAEPLGCIRKINRAGSFLIALLVIAAVIYAAVYHEPVLYLRNFLEHEVSPALFLLLMFTLPLLAAPISVFLLLVGMKFGHIQGVLISAAAMLFHISITYWFTRKWLHSWLDRVPVRLRNPIERLSMQRSHWSALIFMLIPGLPYMLKNIVLAMTGLGFRPYMLINWTTQFLMSIPFVMLGRAIIDMNMPILIAALVLLLALYLLQLHIRTRDISPEKKKEN